MATPVQEFAHLAAELGEDGFTTAGVARIAKRVAAAFRVHEDEVGILRVEGSTLTFCHPAKLRHVGRIPLNTSASVAARTAATRRAEIINNFAQVKHTTLFEAVNLAEESEFPPDPKLGLIQKLMSAPVLREGRASGVLQVTRKGSSPTAAGPDFTPEDLQTLVAIASSLSACLR